MTQRQNRDQLPWWESELVTLRAEQNAYLRRRLPALGQEHDDLVSETLMALTKQIRNHPSVFPASWFKDCAPENEAERSHLHKLAMVILKRRIADLFRKHVSFQNLPSIDDFPENMADPHTPKPDRKILLSRIIEVTRSILDEMAPQDRDLIALISEEAGFRTGLNTRERQRLHRIRKRLKKEIVQRLGAEVADLLRISL